MEDDFLKPKDEQKRQRILTAATAVLATGGLASFSTTKVAKLAGVPQSNLYIYFANKQALLTETYLANVHLQSVAVAAALDATATSQDQLAATITALYQFALANPQATTVIRVLTMDHQFKQDMAPKLADPANQQIQDLLRSGITREILRDTDLNLLRYFLTNPVYRYAEMVRTEQLPASEAGLANLTAMIMGAVLRPAVYQAWLTQD